MFKELYFVIDCVDVKSVNETPSNDYPCGFEKTVKLNLGSSDSRSTLLSQVNNQLTGAVKFVSEREYKLHNEILILFI